jgi:hypothetical protein
MDEEQDIERAAIRDGYPALAGWIARDPDHETLIFRRFGKLAARNVLHLQARLVALEHEIDRLDEQARQSLDLEARQSSRRWESLMKYEKDASRPEKTRIERLERLNKLLREYCMSNNILRHRSVLTAQMRRCFCSRRLPK